MMSPNRGDGGSNKKEWNVWSVWIVDISEPRDSSGFWRIGLVKDLSKEPPTVGPPFPEASHTSDGILQWEWYC